jgi:Family of unknown function (DUF6527)
MSNVLERCTNSLNGEPATEVLLVFQCPGCKCGHFFRVQGPPPAPVWAWNGSMETPTFSPSLFIGRSNPEQQCHSFVREGKIEFLSDCWHDLKGQTVALAPVED